MKREPSPLLPVGLDCDCGHPMVWYGDEQRCAVFGRHLPAHERDIEYRNHQAPLAGVVDELDLMTYPLGKTRTRRADFAGPHLRLVS